MFLKSLLWVCVGFVPVVIRSFPTSETSESVDRPVDRPVDCPVETLFQSSQRKVIGSPEIVSDFFSCSRLSNESCTFQIPVTKSPNTTIEIKNGESLTIDLTEITSRIVYEKLYAINNIVPAASQTSEDGYECIVEPGKKGWLELEPDMSEVIMKSDNICCLKPNEKCIPQDPPQIVEIILRIPNRDENNSVDGQIFCTTE